MSLSNQTVELRIRATYQDPSLQSQLWSNVLCELSVSFAFESLLIDWILQGPRRFDDQ